MKILIINGPNLNLLGVREPEIYGRVTMEDYYESNLQPLAESLGAAMEEEIEIELFQSNYEGEIVGRLQEASYGVAERRADAVILNAGAYTHYSLAIADAIRAINVPVVEVHISNIYAREKERHTSVLSSACVGVMAGFGMDGYQLALSWIATNVNCAD